MKLLVLSDIHGNTDKMYYAIDAEPDADALIFLGDGLAEIEQLQMTRPHMRIYAVRGNCDYSFDAPSEALAGFEGQLVFYTHGNGYDVKLSTTPLKYAARQRGADIVLFGHTHSPYYEYTDGLYVFNPGSCSRPRIGMPTYGIIEIIEGVPRFKHKELPLR